jgi:hypothetical protein
MKRHVPRKRKIAKKSRANSYAENKELTGAWEPTGRPVRAPA